MAILRFQVNYNRGNFTPEAKTSANSRDIFHLKMVIFYSLDLVDWPISNRIAGIETIKATNSNFFHHPTAVVGRRTSDVGRRRLIIADFFRPNWIKSETSGKMKLRVRYKISLWLLS